MSISCSRSVPWQGPCNSVLPLHSWENQGLEVWTLDSSRQRERARGPNTAFSFLDRVGGEIHMVLGHWALAMSQELPAWPCPVPSTLGTSITMSSSSRGRQCPERRGHQPKGRTTRKWPRGGLECRVLRTVSRALSAQRGFGCLAETRKTHWVEGSSGSLWPAKNWYPQTVRNPQAALLPPPPYLGICVLAAQSRGTLYDPMDCSLSVSSVHGILQARILEWVAISFSRGSFQPWD